MGVMHSLKLPTKFEDVSSIQMSGSNFQSLHFFTLEDHSTRTADACLVPWIKEVRK